MQLARIWFAQPIALQTAHKNIIMWFHGTHREEPICERTRAPSWR